MKTLPLVFTVAPAMMLFAADAPKPATPNPKPAEPAKPRPPVLTLDGKSPQLAPAQKNEMQPPGTSQFTSPENTGPVITLNERPAPLAPGVYMASPYTGIVVIPGEMDPKILKQPGPTRDVMPQREPELKLTPKAK